MPTPVADHRAAAADRHATVAILTVSDTRTPDTDTAGALIRKLVEAAGHTVVASQIVRDEPADIDTTLRRWLDTEAHQDSEHPHPNVILTTGGTGFAPRDTTVEVAQRLLTRPGTQRLDGFGELFRMLSYHDIGPAAMLSRALAGVVPASPPHSAPTVLFTLPGSPNAVRLALEKLILPELRHLLGQLHP